LHREASPRKENQVTRIRTALLLVVVLAGLAGSGATVIWGSLNGGDTVIWGS
jgi:hypothetical protein